MASPLSSLYCKTPVSSSESPGYFRQLISIKDLKLKKLKQLYEQELNEKSDVLEELAQVKQEILTLKRESKDKATLVRQLNETIALLEAQLEDENEDEKIKIRNSLERKFKSEIHILEQRFDQCLKEKNELECWKERAETKIKTLTKDVKLRNVELAELDGIKQALTSTLQEQNYEISALKSSCNELRDMLTELNPQKNISIEDSFHGHLPEVTESLAVVVELQLQEKVEENERLQTQVEHLQAGVQKKNDELNNLRSTFSELQQSKNEAERQLTEEIANLQSKITKLATENSDINRKIEENLKELSTMTSKYDHECGRNQHLTEELSQLQASFDEKLKVIAENEDAHSKLLEELKILKFTHSALEESKRESENKFSQEISDLQNRFDNVTSQNAILQQEIDAKNAALLTISSRYENEVDQNQELSKKLVELESSFAETFKELTTSKEISQKLGEEISNLNAVLSELEQSKTQQVQLLNEEISQLKNDLFDLEQQNSTLKRDVEEKCAVLSAISVNQEIERKMNQWLQQQIDAKCSELLTMSQNYENECEQKQELNNKLIELESAFGEISKELTNSRESSQILEEKIGHLNGLLSESEESKKCQVEQLNEEISQLRQNLTDSLEQLNALKRDVEEKQAELLTMSLNQESERDKNQRLGEKLSELESLLDEKTKELFSSEEAAQKLVDELKRMQTCVKDLTKKNDDLKAELDVKAGKLENMIESNEAMAAENAKSLDEIKTLTTKNVELEKENEELKEACDKLRNDFERQFTEMTKMNQSLSRQVEEYRESSQKYESVVEQQIKQMKEDYDDHLVKIQQKDDELNNLRSTFSELQENKNEAERQLTEEIANLQSKITKLTTENSDINCKIEENMKELSTMTSKYDHECSRNQCLTEELSQLQTSFDEKLKMIAENEDAHSKLLEEFKNLKFTHSALEESKRESENKFNEEISNLQSRFDNVTGQNALLQQDIDAKNSELCTISSRYENEHDLNQDLNRKLIELEFSLGETCKELTSCKETSQMLEEKIGHLNGVLSELEGSKTQQAEQLNEEISRLRHDLSNSVEQNSALKRDVEEKRAELLTMSLNQESERDKNQRLSEKLSELESALDEKVKELSTSKEAARKLEDELKEMKSKFMEFAENNNQVVTNMKGEFLQMESYVKELTKQNNDLKAQIDLKNSELQNLSRNHEGEAAENAKTLDEIKGLLEKNVELKEENAELKEAYNKLLDDFERHRTEMTEMNEVLSKQVEEYRDASQKYESKWKERMKQVKEDYEGQLTKIKQYMTKHYHDKMEKQEKEAEEKLKMYKEKIAKDQDCIKDLSSQLWNVSEKFLKAQDEVKNWASNNRRATISRLDLAKSPDGQLLRSMSVDHLRGGWEKEREKLIVKNDNNDIVDEVTYTRRRKLVPSGIGKKLSLQSGKVFPSEEDEDGEMFDAACLADLKEGRVRLSPDRDMRRQSSRLSILQARNSLCPPHLKSSYPAETQFLHPAQIKEDDIKVFTAQKLGLGDNASETGSIVSNPDRKKKDAGQTLYKKPGPPTPSKHGGRLSHGGGPLPKSPTENKENINTRVKHPSTPSKIMDFFRNKMRREERPQPVAFSISPGVNPTANKTRRSGFFTKKSERV